MRFWGIYALRILDVYVRWWKCHAFDIRGLFKAMCLFTSNSSPRENVCPTKKTIVLRRKSHKTHKNAYRNVLFLLQQDISRPRHAFRPEWLQSKLKNRIYWKCKTRECSAQRVVSVYLYFPCSRERGGGANALLIALEIWIYESRKSIERHFIGICCIQCVRYLFL